MSAIRKLVNSAPGLYARSIVRSMKRRAVPLNKILLGGELALRAAQYARHTGDLLRPSTPITEGPHVKLLQQYKELGEGLFEPGVFESTDYYANAAEAIGVAGHYFGATAPGDILPVARDFVTGSKKRGSADAPSTEFSGPTQDVTVAPIPFSDCYEVIDGNHRLASAYVAGQRDYRVRIVGKPCPTPLQQLLLDVSWNPGKTDIYQPISSPELGDQWQRPRKCTDRFKKMQDFLQRAEKAQGANKTYLDVACNYGWFVQQMQTLGFEASGAEIDWAAIEIGKLVYGLRPDQVTKSEASAFLDSQSEKYSVVSCFSLIHHFALGKNRISASDLLQKLDRVTGKVLFFDTGQSHEAWFSESLSEWTPEYIENWVLENSSFTKVVQLGVDEDAVPPFEDNYSRTLFACVRD